MAFECLVNTEVSKAVIDCLSYSNQLHSQIEPQVSKPKSVLNPKKADNTESCSGGSKQVLSITDLPPALISEILNCLDPKELGIVSCASAYLCRLASDHHVWKDFYCERWGLSPPLPFGRLCDDQKSWKKHFVEREFRSKTFMGRYTMELLYGHTESVMTVYLLASAMLLFTSGYDQTVKMWNAEQALLIGSSRSLGCTIRAVAADTKLLVAGGTDGFIHCWKAVEGSPHLFGIRGPQNEDNEFRLWEHHGAITSLALDMTKIYSGSWDMTVRVWDRISLQCVNVLRHNDWVGGLVPHGTTVVTAAGSAVYVWDTVSGDLMTVISNAHVGKTCSLARNHKGDLIFTGGEDGVIHMYEILTTQGFETNERLVATWIPHTGPVQSLAFEFPWLVSASVDGKLSLIDVRKLLKTRRSPSRASDSRRKYEVPSSVEAPQRMLHGFAKDLHSVDIGADRIICGGEEGVVRIWNFTQALEIERRANALRGIRLENRMRRRKLHAENSSKGGRPDKCSVAAKKNPVTGERSGWHSKRGSSGKLKA